MSLFGDCVEVCRCPVCSQRSKHGGDTLRVSEYFFAKPRLALIVLVVVVRSLCALVETHELCMVYIGIAAQC